LKTTLAALLMAGVVGIGATGYETSPSSDPPAQEQKPELPNAEVPKPRVDRFGDPLPPGAIARLGTIRLRPAGPVRSIACAPDGKTLVSANWSQGLHLWDAATGRDLRRFADYEKKVNSVAFASDGKSLASAESNSQSIHVWDVASGKQVREIRVPEQG